MPQNENHLANNPSSKKNIKNIVDWLLFILVGGYAITSIPLDMLIQPPQSGIYRIFDFVWYYDAAQIAIHNIHQVYDVDLQTQALQKLSPMLSEKNVKAFPFAYSPQSLIFFIPLAHLPLIYAYRLWMVFNIMATQLLCWVFSINSPNRSVMMAPTFFLIATSMPWTQAILDGQPILWMTLGFIGSYIFARKSWFFSAALLLCITAFKPYLSIAPALYLCLLYGKPMLRAFFLAASFTIALCSLLYGWQIWGDYIHANMAMAGNLSLYDKSMSTIRAIAEWLIPSHRDAINAIMQVCFGLGLLCVIIMGWLARKRTPDIQDLGFGLILSVSALCSPYLFLHSTLPQAITVYFIYLYSGRTVVFGVFIFSIVTMILPFALSLNGVFIDCRLFPVAELLLIIWSARLLLCRWEQSEQKTQATR